MTKAEFISELRTRLSKLPNLDVEERIRFYEEMINDRMEEGLSEEEAVNDIGTIDAIYYQVSQDAPKTHLKLNKSWQNVRKRRNKIIILASTAIVWAPILIALAAVAFSAAVSISAIAISLYAVLWSLVAVVWALFTSFTVSVPASLVMSLSYLFSGNIISGIGIIGCGMVFAGLAIFSFFGALYATKGSVLLTKKIINAIKELLKR